MNKIINKIFIISSITTFSYSLDFTKHLELSYVDTSGNSNTSTFSAKLETLTKLAEGEELKAKATVLYSKDNDETSANKYDIEVDYNHMINEKLYSYMGINYINDELSDYDYRLNIGPGFGYKFINDDIQTLDIQAGLDYAFDKYENGKKDEYIAPRTETNYRYRINDNMQFKQMLSFLISSEDTEKYFFTSESSLNLKMIENISLGISYRIDYVNQTEKENTDRKFLTSLIIDF